MLKTKHVKKYISLHKNTPNPLKVTSGLGTVNDIRVEPVGHLASVASDQ